MSGTVVEEIIETEKSSMSFILMNNQSSNMLRKKMTMLIKMLTLMMMRITRMVVSLKVGGKQSRSEKKSRKAMLKLKMK
nr:hypothetical protein [Tanacetum cinerariifolium]